MSQRILIIKLGALGDVIRTTPLLRALEGEVTWVTSAAAQPLLNNNSIITKLLTIDQPGFRLDGGYDLVINLEDDVQSATLASSVAAGTIVGPYLHQGSVTYNSSRAEWFDMSLVSRYGRATADQLKLRNNKTYQELIFDAAGLAFQGEEPVLNLALTNAPTRSLIGIEERAGSIWPTKRWTRYQDLADRLKDSGYSVKVFHQRDTVVEYANDIYECEFVICGDTLAMHIALALEKRVVALFTCTSPYEIHGYGRLVKVVSPLLERHFYRRDYSPAPADAISASVVEQQFRDLVRRPKAVPFLVGADSMRDSLRHRAGDEATKGSVAPAAPGLTEMH
jgi:heptosyltransferase II